MDADSFDVIDRSLVSRRRGLTLAAEGLLAPAVPAEDMKKKRKTCKAPQTKCGKQCVDLTTDTAHCGACGVKCQAGLPCTDGGLRRDQRHLLDRPG